MITKMDTAAVIHVGYFMVIGSLFSEITKAEKCILIRADDIYLKTKQESYLTVGKYKIPEKISDDKRLAEVSFKVLVDLEQHDGILFAIGNTPNFKYYEWKKKAVHTVFMVVEFVYSALSVLLKAKGHPYMEQLEIYRTYPHPYNITDGRWHNILVKQEDKVWTLKFDNISVSAPVKNNTDVSLVDKEVFIGGRPGYLYWQFRGIIKDLHINRRPVNLDTAKKHGEVYVEDCNKPVTTDFEKFLRREFSRPAPPTVPAPRVTYRPRSNRRRLGSRRRWSRPPGRR